MTPPLVAALTFVAVFAIIGGMYWSIVLRWRAGVRQRLRPVADLVHPPGAGAGIVRPPTPLSRVPPVHRLLVRIGRPAMALQATLERADVRMTPGVFIALSMVVAICLGVSVAVMRGAGVPSMAFAAVGVFAPYQIVRIRAARRLRRLEEQLPGAIELIARGLRAGYAFGPTLSLVADELSPPLADEFRRVFDRHRYGVPLEEALRALTARVPSPDTRIFATAVLVQRETGGNLAEILDRLAAVVRERFMVERQVRVISAQGRLTAWILVAMPPVLGVGLWTVNPDQMALLVTDETGLMLLGGAVALQVVGTFVIRRIVRVEY